MTLHLTEADQARLNSLSSIDQFPHYYRRATLHSRCAISRSPGEGAALIATGSIWAGERVLASDGERFDRAITYSLQLDEHVHCIGAGALNHRCIDPSCVVDPADGALIAARDISAGEQLEFNYLTTEWALATPFGCRCGHPRCWHHIAGFGRLRIDQRRRLAASLPIARHLQRRMTADAP